MVRVEVRLFANLREAAEKESLFLEFQKAPTISEVLEGLMGCSPRLKKLLTCDGGFNEHYKVLVGTEIIHPENFSKVLDGLKIAVLPPVSGG